jgi:predicted NAD-dependent protein-ADP-ribosyltransferase YbiA (DUF1768 family)
MITPTNKLVKNLALLKSQSPDKQPVVLLSMGSFNPIHNQHVNMFEIAKREIEAQDPNKKVVAGYISPLPKTSYFLKNEIKDGIIDCNHRIKMIELATEDSDWLNLDIWNFKLWNLCFKEAKGKNGWDDGKIFLRYITRGGESAGVERLSNYLNSYSEVSNSTNKKIEVMGLFGVDYAENFPNQFSKMIAKKFKSIVIGKKRSSGWKDRFKNFLDKNIGNNKWNDFILLVDNDDKFDEINYERIRYIIRGRDIWKTDLSLASDPKYQKEIRFACIGKPFREFINWYRAAPIKTAIPSKLTERGEIAPDSEWLTEELVWRSSEDIFQAMKFSEKDKVKLIKEVWEGKIGAEEVGLGKKIRSDWIKGGYNVRSMRWIDKQKFSQHRDLRELLLATGDAELMEDPGKEFFLTPGGNVPLKGDFLVDPSKVPYVPREERKIVNFWSAGYDNSGKNWMGKILMEVREDIKNGRLPFDEENDMTGSGDLSKLLHPKVLGYIKEHKLYSGSEEKEDNKEREVLDSEKHTHTPRERERDRFESNPVLIYW